MMTDTSLDTTTKGKDVTADVKTILNLACRNTQRFRSEGHETTQELHRDHVDNPYVDDPMKSTVQG